MGRKRKIQTESDSDSFEDEDFKPQKEVSTPTLRRGRSRRVKEDNRKVDLEKEERNENNSSRSPTEHATIEQSSPNNHKDENDQGQLPLYPQRRSLRSSRKSGQVPEQDIETIQELDNLIEEEWGSKKKSGRGRTKKIQEPSNEEMGVHNNPEETTTGETNTLDLQEAVETEWR
jgi:hypothetical protein